HVADRVTDLSDLSADVHSENSSGTFCCMKSQESLNQGALAGPVRAKKSYRSSGKRPGQLLEDWAAVERDGQVVEFYCRNHLPGSFRNHKDTETQRKNKGQTLLAERDVLRPL